MPSVKSEILRIIREKDAKIRSGTEAVTALLEELQRQVRVDLGQAALGGWDAYMLREMLDALEQQVADYSTRAKGDMSARLDESWQNGVDLVEAPLRVAGQMWAGFGISTSSLDVLKEFAYHKVEGLYGDAWDRIRSELTLGVLGGKTPEEVATAIGRNLTEPSIFKSIGARAEAITRTEMGRVFSMAAQERMREAAQYVEGLEKMWLHAGHPRVPRLAHLALDGVHIPVEEPFLVGNIAMMFPRDPAAPASEVINCGCAHVPYHEAWEMAA